MSEYHETLKGVMFFSTFITFIGFLIAWTSGILWVRVVSAFVTVLFAVVAVIAASPLLGLGDFLLTGLLLTFLPACSIMGVITMWRKG